MRYLGLFALLLGCPAPRPASPAPTPEAPVPQNLATECLERLQLSQDDSLLAEHRQLASVPDFHTAFAAAAIDPQAQQPVALTVAYSPGGRPLFWYTADRSRIVVDAEWLSDLQVVDVTNLGVGEEAVVGTLTEAARPLLQGRELTRLLLQARGIATWVHIGSELCLRGEDTLPDGGYGARFTGAHTYFTNKENTQPLRFDVLIGADGRIRVRGGR